MVNHSRTSLLDQRADRARRGWKGKGEVLLRLHPALGVLVVVLLVAVAAIAQFSGTAPPEASVFVVPSTINSTCRSDVTVPLENWLYTLPQGSPGHDTVVSFVRHGCYVVNGQVYLRGFRDFVFNGNHSTFVQRAPVIGETTDADLALRPAYCGYSGWTDPRYTEVQTVAIMWLVEGGCDLTFEDMGVTGTNHAEGGGSKMQDSFMAFDGAQRVLVDHVWMHGPYGDYIDVQGLHEAPDGGGAYPGEDVNIENSSFWGSGRDGIAVILAQRVTVEHNTFYSAADTIFDLEFDSFTAAGLQSDINIAHNAIVGQHDAFTLAAITSARLQRIAFVDNTLRRGAQLRIDIAPAQLSNDIVILGNTVSEAATWPGRPTISVHDATETLIERNTVPMFWWKPGEQFGGPFAQVASGTIERNVFVPESIARQTGGILVNEGGVACSNKTSRGRLLDRMCTTQPTVTMPLLALPPR
jgi:hypothetical protein